MFADVLTLEQWLRGIDSETEVDLTTSTVPDMAKADLDGTPNPYLGRVRKRCELRCSIGSDYESAVNDQRQLEGKPRDFKAGPRKWGKHIPGTPLIEHNGRLYLQYQADPDSPCTTSYELDGQPADRKAIDPWLKASKTSPVIVRTVRLEHVVSVEPV